MDKADRDVERAEQGAVPKRLSVSHEEKEEEEEEEHEEIIRITTASSVASSSSGASYETEPERHVRRSNVRASVRFSNVRISRIPMSRRTTQRDSMGNLERHATALSRIETQRTQHSATVGGTLKATESKKPLPEFGAGKPYPPPLPDREEYVVEFDGCDDPLHAQNWPMKKKLITAFILGFTTLTASFGSSIFSAATGAIVHKFHVSSVVATLGTSLYVLGFATGPILWAPLSELKGRRLPLTIATFGFSVFSIGVATGKDLQTVLICRFFSGFFGACPMTTVAAVFSDMFNNRTRGMAITVFAMMVFAGPLLAPFVGGFIVESYLGWRWTEYIAAIMGFTVFTLNLFFLSESYPPQILVGKAAELRRRTKNWGIHAKQEEIEIDFRELVKKNFSRPLVMLFTERIVLLLSIYMAFIYGLLYLFLTAYPLVFHGVHQMNLGVSGLPFFGMIIGQVLAGIYIFMRQPDYQRKLAANNDVPVPEWRLPEVIIGGVSFTIGVFWFGWTGYNPNIHWIVPTVSGLLIGFGLLTIFLQGLNYIVDAYLMFAASAVAGNTFLRSLAGSGFPLFAKQMFVGMGIQWAATLIGCLAVLMVPVPIWFFYRGAKIREKSAFKPMATPKPMFEEFEEFDEE